MSFTIGHTAFTNGPDSGSISRSGGQIAFTLDINLGSLAAAQVADHQLRGYAEEGHPTPVIWDDDGTWGGFYKVVSVSVSPIENYLGNGVMSAQITLERLSESFEIFASNSITRPVNEHAVTPSRLQAVPSTRHFHESDNAATNDTRTTIGGRLMKMTKTEATSRYALRPGDFYDGAVLIEEYYESKWSPLSGRQRLATGATATTWSTPPSPRYPGANNYRVSNGLVRFSFVGESIKVEKSTASAWHPVTLVNLVEVGSVPLVPAGEPTILRNDPLGVTLRYPMGGVPSTGAPIGAGYAPFLDISLRRGTLSATLVLSNKGAEFSTLVAAAIGSTGQTLITGASHATNADANGNRWIIGSEYDLVVVGDPVVIIGTDITSFASAPFFVGAYDLDNDAPADLVNEYWAAIIEEQLPVSL